MKKNIPFVFFFLAASVLFMSNRNGRANSTGLGSTGAPGDDATVCQSCHNGPIDVKLDLTILDNNLDTIQAYEPGKNYTVRINIRHIGGNVPKAYGFQIVSLAAPLGTNGKDLKNWIAIPSNANLVTGRNGRQYVEHKDRSTIGLFEFTWKAPVLGTGAVSFYADGNGVNSDNSSSGDGSSRTSRQLTEKLSSAITEFDKQTLRIVPNPVTDLLHIEGAIGDILDISIFGLLGKLEYKGKYPENGLDLAFLKEGIYFVQLKDKSGEILKTLKMLKKGQRV